MKRLTLGLVALALLTVPTALSAKTRLPSRAEVRQAIQADFVDAATAEGRLAASELDAIAKAQDEVTSHIAAFTRDGRLTPEEAQVLDGLLDRTSLAIDRALDEAARTSEAKFRKASRG